MHAFGDVDKLNSTEIRRLENNFMVSGTLHGLSVA